MSSLSTTAAITAPEPDGDFEYLKLIVLSPILILS